MAEGRASLQPRTTWRSHGHPETDRRQARTDRGALLALILAFVLPPLGALVAIYGRGEGRMSGLRLAAVAIGVIAVIGTIPGGLLGIMALGLANSPS